jgi:hypothetical protein
VLTSLAEEFNLELNKLQKSRLFKLAYGNYKPGPELVIVPKTEKQPEQEGRGILSRHRARGTQKDKSGWKEGGKNKGGQTFALEKHDYLIAMISRLPGYLWYGWAMFVRCRVIRSVEPGGESFGRTMTRRLASNWSLCWASWRTTASPGMGRSVRVFYEVCHLWKGIAFSGRQPRFIQTRSTDSTTG